MKQSSAPSSSLSDDLWNEGVSPANYGKEGQYEEHLFEQYKIFVESADRISVRRSVANSFFLTLHTLIIGAIGFAYEKGPQLATRWLVVFPLIALLALCYLWWRLLKSYEQLNRAKFKIIGKYEKRLPSSPYWAAEWSALAKGQDPEIYQPLGKTEKLIPIVFGVIYLFGASVILFF